jgi:hypothetical protein
MEVAKINMKQLLQMKLNMGLIFCLKENNFMKQNITSFAFIFSLLLAFASCENGASRQSVTEKPSEEPTYKDISGMTLNSRFVYLEFKSGGKLDIYQKTSGAAYARGCTAEGTWSQQGSTVNVAVTQSFCGTNDYSELNGTFTQNGDCISNSSGTYCK